MKVWCKVLAEDGSLDELIACVDKSSSDQEDQSAESALEIMMQRHKETRLTRLQEIDADEIYDHDLDDCNGNRWVYWIVK